MAALTTATAPGASGNPGALGVGSDYFESLAAGTILGAIETQIDVPDATDYPFWRLTTIDSAADVQEGAAAGTTDPVFTRSIGQFERAAIAVEYSDEGISDNEQVRQAFDDELIKLVLRDVAKRIVAPLSTDWWTGANGFGAVTALSRDNSAEIGNLTEDLSTMMETVAESYGADENMTAVLAPEVAKLIRSDNKDSGGFQRLRPTLNRVIEQPQGLEISADAVGGVVGVFDPLTVQLVWKKRPEVRHEYQGTQFSSFRGTARAEARFGLAVLRPTAFKRLTFT